MVQLNYILDTVVRRWADFACLDCNTVLCEGTYMILRTERPANATLVLHIEGRFDAYTVSDVKATWLTDDSVKFVIADLSGTTFIDSMALAALVSGLKVVRQRGGDFILASPAEAVRVILELTSIDRAMTVVDSVDEGLRLVAA